MSTHVPAPADPTLEAVRAVGRIDAVPSILEVVCRTTGMRFAAVARVTESRWTVCAVKDDIAFGLKPGDDLVLETTICNEIRGSGEPVVIDQVSADPHWREHHTPRQYGFESYISWPIRLADGSFFGTLCAIDPAPARVSELQNREMFRLFAELIGFHLDAQHRLQRSEAALMDEREAAELREQFIAVLGHDLRSPLAAIDAGAKLLRRGGVDARGGGILDHIEASVGRMARMVDDVLDLARGRLGGGVPVSRASAPGLADALAQVVDEFRVAWPNRVIESEIIVAAPPACDTDRLSQLASNLIANALSHGAPDRPVRVRTDETPGAFRLTVSNEGVPIAPATAARLFQPFSRGTAGQGLGLGLYIASEIARAHGGDLTVASDAAETRFTFSMPT